MLNLNDVLVLTEEQNEIIQGFGTLTAEHWKRNETRLRKAIRDRLKSMQNNCCVYCGCRVWGVGDVEHIAHKADYPQFLFTPQNLAYSCKTCNQTYKGQTDIVGYADTTYQNCQFRIVHPYLDDVDMFFDTTKFAIQIKPGLSAPDQEKAIATRTLFHWLDPEVVEHRAMLAMAQGYAVEHNTTIDQVSYEDVLTYIPGRL